jgi:hypothetical protein
MFNLDAFSEKLNYPPPGCRKFEPVPRKSKAVMAASLRNHIVLKTVCQGFYFMGILVTNQVWLPRLNATAITPDIDLFSRKGFKAAEEQRE